MINLSQSAGKTRLPDDYLIGFVEGEGMFYIGIVPSKETKSGWQVIYFFKVSQNPQGIKVLNALNNRLQCGYIKSNSKTDKTDKSLAFVVRDFESLRLKVVPFFEGKLIIKKKAFENFKKVLELVSLKKHLTKDGIEKILDLAYSMNTQKRKFTKSRILTDYTSDPE